MNPVRNTKALREKNKISNGVKIIIKNLQKKIPVDPKRIKKTILKVFSQEGIKKSGEISVSFVNDKEIRGLNLKYRGRNSPTDVLAFDITGPKDLPRTCTQVRGLQRILADIVISTDTAMRNARIFKTTPYFELELYLIHGILHLVGYDDFNPKQRRQMRQKEKKYVNTQG